MRDWKAETIRFYQDHAGAYEQRTKAILEDKAFLEKRDAFLSLLPGKEILDLGSGPGRDATYFKKQGYNPLCLDISPEMVKRCQQKGLTAITEDIETLNLNKQFDGIWSCASLVHLPKQHLPATLKKMKIHLRPKGILHIGMKEGSFEGYQYDKRVEDWRFISLWENNPLVNTITKEFQILSFDRIEPDRLDYLCTPH
ncbi:SAM-dependent methyltransferase [Candidatus Pacearchaeota archaeon]|jgi:SAM-dependent methyltransferase|nr:SAM-dependent methyltransferase [Candidatus Pacearchaeota archaeon]